MTDDHTTPADRRGMERAKIEARIEELERQKNTVERRLDDLRAELAGLFPDDPDSPRKVVRGHAERLEGEDGVAPERLLEAATDEGLDRDVAEAALDALKRQGELWEAEGKIRVT